MQMLYSSKCGSRPIRKFRNILSALVLWTTVGLTSSQMFEPVPVRGAYMGCYLERIDLYESRIVVGIVDKCIEFCEGSYFRYAVLSHDKCACTNEQPGEMIEKSICSTRCSRNKSRFCGGVNVQSYYDTGLIASGPPKNLQITNETETTLTLYWDEPQQAKYVTKYSLKANVIRAFASDAVRSPLEWTVENKAKHFELVDLHPWTMYNISLSAFCHDKECGTSHITGETIIGDPYPPPETPKIVEQTDTTLTVEINPATNDNGPISYYRLIVNFVDDILVQTFDEQLLTNYNQSKEDGLPYYIAAEIDYINQTRRFVIGDGRIYRTKSGQYYNAPLPPNSHVHVSLGIVSSYNGVRKATYAIGTHEQHGVIKSFDYVEEEESPPIALIIACVVFGLLLIGSIAAYAYLHYKTGPRRQRLSDHHEMTPQGPILEIDNNGHILDDQYMAENFKTKLNNMIENIEPSKRFQRNAIRLDMGQVLANGSFGDVMRGTLYTNVGSYESRVHVITTDDMEPNDQVLLLTELEQILCVMPHDSFLDFYGVSASADLFYVIFENTTSTLKKELVDARYELNENRPRFTHLSEETVLRWIYEISAAMEFLSLKQIVHQKLCSYSVLFTESNHLKLSMFGPISLDMNGKRVDITRWMAPEVLRFQRHSVQSDVWSFACLAWECCTLGATLFSSIPSQDILPRVRNGERPHQPRYVSNELYQLLIDCWQIDGSDRPSFEAIMQHLTHMLISPTHFLSFDRRNGMSLEYFLPLLEEVNE